MSQKPTRTPDFRSQVNDLISVKRNQRIILVSLSLAGLCVLAVFGVLLLYWADMLPGTASKTPGEQKAQSLAAKSEPSPTPKCSKSQLIIGSSKYQIQTIERTADQTLQIPKDNKDNAYWVDGTNSVFVFGLNASTTNLALQTSLKTGDLIQIAWGDCSKDEYIVESVETGVPDPTALFDQSGSGIRVFVQNDPSSTGFVILGVRPGARTAQTAEPTAEAGVTKAQVDFLETVVSRDRKTLKLSIAITNLGSTPITLVSKDISLGAENQAPQQPLSVEPSLPQEIAPGNKANFTIVFEKPQTATAVFKLGDFSVDLYY